MSCPKRIWALVLSGRADKVGSGGRRHYPRTPQPLAVHALACDLLPAPSEELVSAFLGSRAFPDHLEHLAFALNDYTGSLPTVEDERIPPFPVILPPL